jgi:hypothetical protein
MPPFHHPLNAAGVVENHNFIPTPNWPDSLKRYKQSIAFDHPRTKKPIPVLEKAFQGLLI